MVRFFCFNSRIPRHRPKESVEGLSERVIREDGSNSKGLSSSSIGESSKLADDSTSAIERIWKSEEIKPQETGKHHVSHLKKSQSHGDELYLDGRDATENGTDDGTDRVGSPNSLEQRETLAAGMSSTKRLERSPNVVYQTKQPRDRDGDRKLGRERGRETSNLKFVDTETFPERLLLCPSPYPTILDVPGSPHTYWGRFLCVPETSPSPRRTRYVRRHQVGVPVQPRYQKDAPGSVSACQGSDQALYGSIFSVGDLRNDDISLYGEQMENSNSQTPYGSPLLVRSNSMPNIADSASGKSSPLKYSSRSSDDLCALGRRQRDKPVHETDAKAKQNQDYDDDANGYSSMAKDWIVPATDELNSTKFIKGETSNQPAGYPGKDSKFKRIDDWVNDLQHVNSSAEEADEIDDDEFQREPELTTAASPSVDVMKSTPGMEAAKKYFSSLSSAATTAQLVSRGLVVIPLLSKFVGLRVLNLSGNAIVKITAGALPRGLHALNLSKNCISVIEGLRELTRLRVLDLRYNKILRLGHGLASCSSLKELYLAGNKISEIEGLHRLLKLAVLDLRFNKFSTTKCLGLLAANYSSLQAISLEGNPAQKNVGDEQLRKYLLGLLPHLVYYNRQGAKDARLGTSTLQLERGLRSELKNNGRKSSHGASSTHKAGSSSAARKASSGVQKRSSKERSSSRLPPVGHKVSPAAYENYCVASGDRLATLRSELSMRRTRSEGNLGPI